MVTNCPRPATHGQISVLMSHKPGQFRRFCALKSTAVPRCHKLCLKVNTFDNLSRSCDSKSTPVTICQVPSYCTYIPQPAYVRTGCTYGTMYVQEGQPMYVHPPTGLCTYRVSVLAQRSMYVHRTSKSDFSGPSPIAQKIFRPFYVVRKKFSPTTHAQPPTTLGHTTHHLPAMAP